MDSVPDLSRCPSHGHSCTVCAAPPCPHQSALLRFCAYCRRADASRPVTGARCGSARTCIIFEASPQRSYHRDQRRCANQLMVRYPQVDRTDKQRLFLKQPSVRHGPPSFDSATNVSSQPQSRTATLRNCACNLGPDRCGMRQPDGERGVRAQSIERHTSTSPKMSTLFAHRQFSRLCHAAHALKLPPTSFSLCLALLSAPSLLLSKQSSLLSSCSFFSVLARAVTSSLACLS